MYSQLNFDIDEGGKSLIRMRSAEQFLALSALGQPVVADFQGTVSVMREEGWRQQRTVEQFPSGSTNPSNEI